MESKIKESHFDIYDYSNFCKKTVSKKDVQNFFDCMPKHLRDMIEEEFAKNKAEWEKDKEKYFLASMRGPRDGYIFNMLNESKPNWFRDNVPFWIRKPIIDVKSYYRHVVKEKVYPWYYPIEDRYEDAKTFVQNIYTKHKHGYTKYDVWNFDFNIAKLMVPRLLAVRDMERHAFVRNIEASEALFEETQDPSSYVAYTDEELREIMNSVIFGFMIRESDAFDFNDSQWSLPNDSYWKIVKAVAEEQQKGRELFAKHFYHFGD